MSVSEWLSRIQQNNLKIAMDSPMLESVIQQQDLHIELFHCDLGDRNSIGRLEMGNVGKPVLQLLGLVVDSIRARPIASRQYRYPYVVVSKPLG